MIKVSSPILYLKKTASLKMNNNQVSESQGLLHKRKKGLERLSPCSCFFLLLGSIYVLHWQSSSRLCGNQAAWGSKELCTGLITTFLSWMDHWSLLNRRVKPFPLQRFSFSDLIEAFQCLRLQMSKDLLPCNWEHCCSRELYLRRTRSLKWQDWQSDFKHTR